MKFSISSILKKLLKITGITIGSVLVLLFLAPYIFPNTVAEKIKGWTNSSIKGELNFSKARLSFFKHFPSLTLTLYDFSLKGSAPYQRDTLVAADEMALGINLETLLFNKKIKINKIYLTHAYVDVEINEKGEANYNIYDSKSEQKTSATTDTAGTSLKLEKIRIEKSRFIYNDRSIPMILDAKNFNYEGTGDLSQAIFDLQSHISIDSLNFNLENQSYLTQKKVDADLITKINTNSLAFLFEKNDLVINKLALQFTGTLNFLKNGYDMDLLVNSNKSELHDLITALPPQYQSWLEKTKVKGNVDLSLNLKGAYIASTNTMPSLIFNMKIRNGFIAYKDAPAPASNLLANLDVQWPSFNNDSLQVKMDSLFFNVDKSYFRASLRTTGMAQPYIDAKADAQLDLEQLNKAFGIDLFTAKGNLKLKLDAAGKYETGLNPKSLRKKDTIILSIPKFNIESFLKGGYFKYKSLPESITGISLSMHASCPDNDYKKSVFKIDTLYAAVLNNFIKGSASISSMKDFPLEANILANINLADIKKCYPLDSMDLAGILKLNINTKGKYSPAKKLFPRTTANMELQNGSIQTKYYPHPIENIQVVAKASDADGSLSGLQVFIEPASFQFEGKPFMLHASLQNFDDLLYDIKAHGEIDIGKIYKVFSREGIDVTGYAKTALSLQGRQSDAVNARYNKLNNSGSIELKNLQLTHEYFPKPFMIKQGLFNFKQDKMWFDKFIVVYGKSDFRLDGFLENVINYFISSDAKLKGNFNLGANFISVDEFAVFATPANNTKKEKPVSTTDTVSSKSAGVVIIPANLDLIIKANANTISYNGLDIKNFTGGLTISNAQLQLQETAFTLIGCSVNMDGMYGSTSPTRAVFQYHLLAKDFDIKKAYDDVKLFHDLFTSAGNMQGIVSLDYNLKGRLNADMYPVYPSLTGGGVLSVKNVKVKGLKLLNAVSAKTEKQDIKDPDLSKIDFKTMIKNNLITLERVKFKTSGFRLRLEGQTSFDGKLNLKIRLGLPPLGIIGIPMRVTGTSDNPNIKLGKNDKEELTGTEDE